MKIKSVVAVGAMGIGLGLAGLIGASTASAQDDPTCEESTAPFTAARTACVAGENLAIFGDSLSPQRNIGILLNGTEDNPELGLRNQLNGSTFTSSVGDFLNGPRAPEGPDQPAAPGTPPGGSD